MPTKKPNPKQWAKLRGWTLIADSDVSGKMEAAYLVNDAIIRWVTWPAKPTKGNVVRPPRIETIDPFTLYVRLARWTIGDPAVARRLGL